MKTIDIESKKKILKKAKKVLNCILEAKKRIDWQEQDIQRYRHEWFFATGWYEKQVSDHKAAIVKLERYYHKIISRL